ncbi:signal transduction histidine kinase [Silvibacterium bohemicum]|uniref:histidine kinase n=1 Tax=Silvibacterium bohemicum TaxID=1577686 RepID=A0A841JUZ4_9BACT|nr:ATP-binding protein [Silvibacterium bohemicum]MBB6142248.1 signal transduction histidine kinase [Silvibacterium bohemicum]
MEDKQTNLSTTTVPARELYAELKQISIFQQVKEQDLDCLGTVEIATVPAGEILVETGETNLFYWVLLDGELRIVKFEADGGSSLLGALKKGDTFGEVPLLTGSPAAIVHVEAVADSRLVRVNSSGFWNLMSSCPVVRAGVLANMGRRLEAYQVLTLHREKLISLGTLAAGLMHELNNPGAAARRAASQLRENLTRLQEISLRFSESELTPEQKKCLSQLQAEALRYRKPQALSSIEQADAEDELLQWLESAGVENAWKLAPTLVQVGWQCEDIECAQHAFPREILSDALNWLESLISSMQLVGTIEESIARVTDLVVAVKKYAYDDKNRAREIDLHDSIQSTITILAHKFRHKQLTVDKFFASNMPTIQTTGTGLSQVWTNILDNAIDASPEGGKVTIRTWMEGDEACVGIADQGSGVPEEFREHIFEPFFTTKPAGVGTGLGLDIAHRIVVGQFHGKIAFDSQTGNTEFIVRLPAATPASK